MFENVPLSVALPASDIERAKRWYSDTLGLEPVRTDELMGAEYETGGARFLVYPSEFAGTNQATAAGFTVENFDELIAQLREKGVAFEDVDLGEMGKTVDGVVASPDGTQKGAWFKDSEGNILAVSTSM